MVCFFLMLRVHSVPFCWWLLSLQQEESGKGGERREEERGKGPGHGRNVLSFPFHVLVPLMFKRSGSSFARRGKGTHVRRIAHYYLSFAVATFCNVSILLLSVTFHYYNCEVLRFAVFASRFRWWSRVSVVYRERALPGRTCVPFRSVASASPVVQALLLENGSDPKLVEDSWRLPFRTLVSDVSFYTLFSADVHFGTLFLALRLLAVALPFGALVCTLL
jgi:hypothetical protein